MPLIRENLTPPITVVLASWMFDPIAAAVIAVLGVGYGLGVAAARRRGSPWPLPLIVRFYALGLGSMGVVSFGFLGVYSGELRYAFTTRIALLLFAVPALLTLGKPIALGKAALGGGAARLARSFLHSLPVRFVSSMIFAPVFALIAFSVFLTPLAGTLRESVGAQATLTVVLPLFGFVMIAPIVEQSAKRTSFYMTAQFMLLFFELLVDSVPAILLRLSGSVLDTVPAAVGVSWFPNPLHDQHLAADLLWFIVEVADVPLLVLLFIRWSKIDKSEAKHVDDLSDEEVEALTREHLRRRSY